MSSRLFSRAYICDKQFLYFQIWIFHPALKIQFQSVLYFHFFSFYLHSNINHYAIELAYLLQFTRRNNTTSSPP